MFQRILLCVFMHIIVVFTHVEKTWADPVIVSEKTVYVELTVFTALAEDTILKGEIEAGKKQNVDITYRGLALLSFSQGQTYPLIITDKPLTIRIDESGTRPIFEDGTENDYFYKLLAGAKPEDEKYSFANLMIRAKNLLESSYSIKTVEELAAKKKEFHGFVRKNYTDLQKSDMVRRLIGQYFMMHEYVNYHREGEEPATSIQAKYQREVLDGVGDWLGTLKPHIPAHEVLNYCVSLYYGRSMVSLASLIVNQYREVAYCPGIDMSLHEFAKDIKVKGVNNQGLKRLADFKGGKLITFVSEECPVSMVEAVVKARKLARQKVDTPVIAFPLEKLSDNHLVMARMLTSNNMYFIDDDKWRQEYLKTKIKLPFFTMLD